MLFTRDLRVHDHPALTAAILPGEPIVPLFVMEPKLLARSANRARFLVECLADLDRSLVRRGGWLCLRRGEVVAATVRCAVEAGARAVHLTSDVTSYAGNRETGLRVGLAEQGIELFVHPGNAVVEPGDATPPGKERYAIFTPYHRAWMQVPRRSVLRPPDRITVPGGFDRGPRPDPGRVRPDSIDLAPGGETSARKHFESYLAMGVGRYGELRDDPAADATSRLSPYLRFGCLSANEVVARLTGLAGSVELVRQVAWRDFYAQLLAADPAIQWHDHRPPPLDVPPVPDQADDLMDRWRNGLTGLPLVDAGMRQLRREGWMHNRVRMIVASFLTRRLGLPWQEGAAHFFSLLLDGDPASNSGGWQWAAGTGTDPRRSRSFNPVRQARRFDPSGAYARRYVRELAEVEADEIFAPWKHPELLRVTGYPAPIAEVPDPGTSGPGVPPFAGGPAHPGQTPLFPPSR
jgi:deoxyribodipyrimidine photo-lyase